MVYYIIVARSEESETDAKQMRIKEDNALEQLTVIN